MVIVAVVILYLFFMYFNAVVCHFYFCFVCIFILMFWCFCSLVVSGHFHLFSYFVPVSLFQCFAFAVKY